MPSKARHPLAERLKAGLKEAIAHVKGELTLKQVDVGDNSLEPMSPQKGRKQPKWDSRLIGTWKSDRRRTFLRYQPKQDSTPARVRKLKSLFGKMTIRWGRGKCYSDYQGTRETSRYELLGTDAGSVVVRILDDSLQPGRIYQIHFEDDYYWIGLGSGLCEYFRRIS